MVAKPSPMLKGVANLLTATFLYGLFGVLSRTVGLTIPIFYQNVTRNLVAVVILTIIVGAQRAWKPVTKRDLRIMIVRSLAGGVAFLSFFYTIINVPFGASYFLFFAGSVLFGYVFGHYWFSEHLTKIKIVSLVCAILGLLLVYQVNIAVVSPLYFGLAILAGATTAVWDVISKKISGSYAASYISFWDESIAIVLYTVLSVVTREPWSLPALTAPWMASLGIGVLFVATGILVVNGFKYVEAQIGSIILLAEILFAIFFGWLIYGETISLLTLVGGAFIITAIVLPELYSKSR